MKTPLLLLACVATLTGFGRLAAEDPDDAPVLLPPDQIETLVAPIALYPDPLVALILPASTHPADVVLAARFLAGGGSPENVLSEPWDESVKALTRYREVVDYLDRNLDWTRRLGDCFIFQPDDVMDAIQEVRARARAAGMLADSPQQEVIIEAEEICIVPTNPTVIYVPRYDPFVLCGPRLTTYYPRTWITFGVAYNVGPWLRYDCDWRSRHVRIAHRPPSWYYRPDWRRHHQTSPDVDWTRWTPPTRRERHFDRRDHDNRPGTERRWIGANETIRPAAPPSDIGRARGSDRDHTPSPSLERERRTRPDFNRRPRRDPSSPVPTAPSVVATSPNVPTAPVLASQPPASFSPSSPPFSEHRRSPRHDGDGRRPDRYPRADARPGLPPAIVTAPPPMTSSPVGPTVQPPKPMVRSGDETNRRVSPDREDRGGRDRTPWNRGRDRTQQN